MVAFLNIKKKNSKKNSQYIKSVDSYNGNEETFVYNSYPNNQMINNQNQMNYQNNMNYNQPMINNQNNMNYNQPIMNNQNNMNYNQPMNNQMPSQMMNNQPYQNTNQVNSNINNTPKVIKPQLNKQNDNVIKPQISTANETLDVLEPNEVLTESLEESPIEQETPKLDPLNNANNPIPVNPVAPVEKKEELTLEEQNAKASLMVVVGMIIGMIFHPGTTIIDSIKKYKDVFKGIMITVWLTVVTIIATIGVRILAGAFYRSYNSVTGAYSINFNFNNVFSLQNYTSYLVIALLVSAVAIMVVTLIYYASSFFNSKGIHFGAYLAVSNVSLIPMILGVVVLNPVLSILSTYLGMIGIILPFIYSLISFIIGIDYILEFKDLNSKIYYNVFNLTLILFVMILIVMGLVNFNLITVPSILT